MKSKYPEVECKLFQQTTNEYGLYLEDSPLSTYYEKEGQYKNTLLT